MSTENRKSAFLLIEEENEKLNCYSPIENQRDLYHRLEDIAITLQSLALSSNDQSSLLSFQYDVLDIMDIIKYLKENLKDEI